MEYLFLAIIDELKNNDMKINEGIFTPDDLIMEYDKYYKIIRIYHVKTSHNEHYIIPSQLSLEKIINLIWSIFDNDHLNFFAHPEKNNLYIKIDYHSLGLCASLMYSYELTNSYKYNERVILYSPKMNIKSILTEKLERLSNVIILYKL